MRRLVGSRSPRVRRHSSQPSRSGKRERLVQVVKPEGLPYDFGRFEIVEEDWVDEG